MSRYLKVTVAAAVAGTALMFAGTATAQPEDTPESGDDRATAYSGNFVGKDCATLFPGSHEVTGELTYSVDGSNTYLDITGTGDAAVVGVIVKGGNGYNVYEPGDLGLLPWLDLHSPLVSSGKPAQISHWLACGTGGSTTTTTTPPTDTTTTSAPTDTSTSTTETSTPGGTTTTGTETSTPSSSGAAVTTTTSAAVSPAAEDEDLASTGFNGGWLVALGAALLLGGGALLLVMRARGARS